MRTFTSAERKNRTTNPLTINYKPVISQDAVKNQ